MQPSSTSASVRHARIIPSFLLRWASRTLLTGAGKIGAQDLIDWRGAVLSEISRAEIRALYIARFRVHFQDIWDQPVGILTEEGTPVAMDGVDSARVRALLQAFPDGGLRTATFRQVKEALKLPIAQVLRILANMEASYWGPHHVKQAVEQRAGLLQAAAPAPQGPETPALERSADWGGLARVVLGRPWVLALEPSDLRFPARNHQPLHQYLLERLDRGTLTESEATLLDHLMQAERCSWAEELHQVAHALMGHVSYAGLDASGRARRIEIFMLRFGGLSGRTLACVGNQLGLTRERVRQVCSQLAEQLEDLPCQMPALERVLAAAARVAPFSIQDANEQLAKMLGEGVGVEAAIEFAEQIKRPIPLQVVSKRARSFDGGGMVTVLVEDERQASWMKPALAFVRRDCMAMGCTNFLRVAGSLALEEGVLVDRDSLVSVLKTIPGYRQLGTDSYWFAVEDSERSYLADRVRRIMHAASGPVMLDSIMAGLTTDARWVSRSDNSASAVPPIHIVALMLAEWPWLSIDVHNRCKLKEERDAAARSPALELGLIRAIADLGGVATKTELVKTGTQEMGMSEIAVSMVVGSSPVIERLEHSLYAVRGRPLNTVSLEKARERRALEISKRQAHHFLGLHGSSPSIAPGVPVKVSFTRPKSELPIQRLFVYLPAFFKAHIHGQFEHKEGKFSPISVSKSLQIPRLVMYAVQSGCSDVFQVEFDLEARTYSILPPGNEPEQTGGPVS